MKKALIPILVLAMASMAGATLQISVEDNWYPVDSEISVGPSDTLTLGIWTDAPIPDGLTWALYCHTSWGSISGGSYVGPDDGGNILGFIYEPATDYGVLLPDGYDGVMGGIAVFAGSGVAADTLLYDDILFHCEWETAGCDVVTYLALIDDGTGEIEEIMDTVIFHPPAEPTSILLLGLGIVALRQKRR